MTNPYIKYFTMEDNIENDTNPIDTDREPTSKEERILKGFLEESEHE